MNQPFPQMQQDPDELVAKAVEQYAPVGRLLMFSGGNDSTVLAHRMRDSYDFLFHMDTGTSIDEGPRFSVRQFVQDFAQWVDKPLLVYSPGPDDTYESLVLKHGGFPGPAGHGRAYTRLKERQIEDALRHFKRGQHRLSTVMFLSGKRRAESGRRKRTTLGIEKREGSSQLYANPLIDWTTQDMRAYRLEREIPESPVAAMLHRSGECNCGAFAKASEERGMIEDLAPRSFTDPIRRLERLVEQQGDRWCRWGGYDRAGIRAGEDDEADPTCKPGIACSDCDGEEEDLNLLELAA